MATVVDTAGPELLGIIFVSEDFRVSTLLTGISWLAAISTG